MIHKGYGWDALSQAAHTLASWRAAGADNWNKVYQDELRKIGFELMAIPDGTELGPTGPLQAPLPTEGDPDGWETPSIIVPVGWMTDDL